MVLKQEIKARYTDKLREIAGHFKEKHKATLRVDEDAIAKVFTYFNGYEEKLKKCMLPEETDNVKKEDNANETDNVLDRHKIAAAFFCAIIKAKPLDFVRNKAAAAKGRKTSDKELKKQANKECAYVFSMQIIQDFLNKQHAEATSPDEKEIYNNKIRLPETHYDTYALWFLKLITDEMAAHLDYKSEKFEEVMVFFISHIFFMMENYSYQFYRAEFNKGRSKAN